MLFETQSTWARAEDPVEAIKQIVRMGGLDPAMVDTCMADSAAAAAGGGSHSFLLDDDSSIPFTAADVAASAGASRAQ